MVITAKRHACGARCTHRREEKCIQGVYKQPKKEVVMKT
jgi:hypothetical protein